MVLDVDLLEDGSLEDDLSVDVRVEKGKITIDTLQIESEGGIEFSRTPPRYLESKLRRDGSIYVFPTGENGRIKLVRSYAPWPIEDTKRPVLLHSSIIHATVVLDGRVYVIDMGPRPESDEFQDRPYLLQHHYNASNRVKLLAINQFDDESLPRLDLVVPEMSSTSHGVQYYGVAYRPSQQKK